MYSIWPEFDDKVAYCCVYVTYCWFLVLSSDKWSPQRHCDDSYLSYHMESKFRCHIRILASLSIYQPSCELAVKTDVKTNLLKHLLSKPSPSSLLVHLSDHVLVDFFLYFHICHSLPPTYFTIAPRLMQLTVACNCCLHMCLRMLITFSISHHLTCFQLCVVGVETSIPLKGPLIFCS